MTYMKTGLIAVIGLAALAAATSLYAAVDTGGDEHDHTSHAAAPATPQERDPNRLWCREHGVYEDECGICHPEILETAEETHLAGDDHDHAHGADGAHTTRDGILWCNEHDVAEAECGICQPQLLNELSTGQGLKLRLPSSASLEKAGVATGRPFAAPDVSAQGVLGKIAFNRNHFAAVPSLRDGVVQEVRVDVGAEVEAGQLLAVVLSPAVAEAKSAYVKAFGEVELAQRNHVREQDLHAREISARRDLDAARAALAAAQSDRDYARHYLLNLGVTEEDVNEVARTRAITSHLSVRAPFAGTVVERQAVPGASVDAGAQLFAVADLSTVWMELSVPEPLLGSFPVDTPVQARFDAYPGLSFEGRVAWVAYSVNDRTRMVEARAVFPNSQRLLREGMFGKAAVAVSAAHAGVSVPESAVQEVDGRRVVFAKVEDDLFETRIVETGGSRDGRVVLRAGLSHDEEIVVSAGHILKSELLKARLGAGCADH